MHRVAWKVTEVSDRLRMNAPKPYALSVAGLIVLIFLPTTVTERSRCGARTSMRLTFHRPVDATLHMS